MVPRDVLSFVSSSRGVVALGVEGEIRFERLPLLGGALIRKHGCDGQSVLYRPFFGENGDSGTLSQGRRRFF